MVWFLFEGGLIGVTGGALAGVVWWAARQPSVCRTAARVEESPIQRAFGVAALAGLASIGVSLAKVVSLPMGTAGLAVGGPALFAYAHVELLAAAHGFRSLDLAWDVEDGRLAGLRRCEHWFAGWTTYVTERHASLPFAFIGLFVVAIPSAFVLVAPAADAWTLPLYLGGAVSFEAALFVFGTGYGRRSLLPEEPEEDVRAAVE